MFRDNNRFSTKIINIKKVLEYLRNFEKFNSRHLFDTDLIAKGNINVIIELFIDIHHYYSKNVTLMARSKSNRSLALNYKTKNNVTNKSSMSLKPISVDNSQILSNKKSDKQTLTKKKEYSKTFQAKNNESIITNNFILIEENEPLYLQNTKSKSNKISPRPKNNTYSNNLNIKSTTISPNTTPKFKRNMQTPSQEKEVFVTFDKNNAKKMNNVLEKSIRSKSSHKDAPTYNNYTINLIEAYPSPKEKGSLLDFTQNNIKREITSQFNNSKKSNLTETFSQNDIINIQDWLYSMGIEFAYNIDFNKKELKEFKDG